MMATMSIEIRFANYTSKYCGREEFHRNKVVVNETPTAKTPYFSRLDRVSLHIPL